MASTFYVVGGVLTLKISNKSNENVTASIMIWAVIFLLPLSIFFEQPWNLTPRLDSTISLIYLGIFATGNGLAIKILYIKKKWFSFSGTGCLSHTYFWCNFGIFNFGMKKLLQK